MYNYSENKIHKPNQRGTTLLEITIAISVIVVILTVIYQTLIGSRSMFDTASTQVELQRNARHTLHSIIEELQISGKVSSPYSHDYPYIPTSEGYEYGNEIYYKLPLFTTDENGDRVPVINNGVLEWDPAEYCIKVLPDSVSSGKLVVQKDGETIKILGRHIQTIEFRNHYTDPSVKLNHVLITVRFEKQVYESVGLKYEMSTCVHIRN